MESLDDVATSQAEAELRQEPFESNPHHVELKEVIARGTTGWIRRSYSPFQLEARGDGDGDIVFYAGKSMPLCRKGRVERKLQVARVLREISLLKECSKGCIFVVRFLDAFFDGENRIELGTEFCELGSLCGVKELIAVRKETLKCVLFCAFSAVAHVHSLGIVHGDVKPSNLLVTRTGIVKLCDFGASQKLNEYVNDDTAELGTLRYAAPEILPRFLSGNKAVVIRGCAQDIWALGVVAVDLFYGPDLPKDIVVQGSIGARQNITGSSKETYAYQVAEVWEEIVHAEKLGLERAATNGEATQALVQFVRGCLTVSPKDRPSATVLLHGRYLQKQKTKLMFAQVLSSLPEEIDKQKRNLAQS